MTLISKALDQKYGDRQMDELLPSFLEQVYSLPAPALHSRFADENA